MSRTLVGYKLLGHSDVDEASPADYILIFDLTPGFNGLIEDNCATRRETFKFLGVRLILKILR